MQRSILHLEVNFNNLLAVIPATAGIGPEHRLEQTEEGDTEQITNEEVGVKEGERQTHEEDHDENIDHTLLCILGADLDDFLGVFNRSFLLVQFDVLLDVHNGLIRAGDNCLYGSAGKPELTVKQQRFIDAYDGNATEAAIVAGYSKKTAAVIALENLRKPNIAEAIRKRE